MKALVLKEAGKFVYTDVPTPEPGVGEIQIRIRAVSICGSDVHGYDGASGRRQPELILGHEASGVVSKVGDGASKFHVGDRVVFNSVRYCGTCYYCRRGLLNLCENGCCYGIRTGTQHLEGAMCEYLTVPEYICYRIPENVSNETAALIEPLSIALHAVNGVEVRAADTAVVFGAGVVGLMMLKVLKTTGCSRVFVVELDETKRQMALDNGADHVIDGREDVPARVRELTGGRGADFALEAVGVGATVAGAVCCLRKAGVLIQVGNVSPGVEIPLQTVVMNEIQIRGRYGTATEYETALALVASGRIRVEDCISKVAPLRDGQEWFDRLHRAEPGLVKVILVP